MERVNISDTPETECRKSGSYSPYGFKGGFHRATGFRNGLALSTGNVNEYDWMTYLVCEYSRVNLYSHSNKIEALSFHGFYVYYIESFLLLPLKEVPLYIRKDQVLTNTLVKWRLAGWV